MTTHTLLCPISYRTVSVTVGCDLSRDLVGQAFVDASAIYFARHHELWRTWVALQAPHGDRTRFFGKDARGGVQGYVRLSITLLGEGDSPCIHLEEEDESPILLPPSICQRVAFLRVGVYCTRHLPRMDSTGVPT